MSDELVSIRGAGSTIVYEGPLWTADVTATISKNVRDAVYAIARRAVPMVRARITPKNGTGYTADAIEAWVYPRVSRGMITYGKVRMAPGLSREPGSPNYSAERRPYIIAAVLESGKYNRVVQTVYTRRGRRYTKTSGGIRRQKPLWQFRDTARQLRPQAAGIADSIRLAKGIE